MQALEALSRELGVSPSTLAQYADAAGSYTIRNSHETAHKRTLPPRGSVDGILLAQRIRTECGTEKLRTLVAKNKRQGK
jgi:hypothetical protein